MATTEAMITVRRLRALLASSAASARSATGGSDVEVAAMAWPPPRGATADIGVVAAVCAPPIPEVGRTSVAHESAGGAATSRPRETRCRSESIAAALG